MNNVSANTLYSQFIVGAGRGKAKKIRNEAAVHDDASGLTISYTHPKHKIVFCPFHAFF